MRPMFMDEMARIRAEDLRREGASERRAAAAGKPAGERPGLRDALGMRMVRAGFRMIGSAA